MAKTITDYVLGSIPDKVRIIKGTPETVSWAWENYVVAQHDVKHDTKAHPVWIADASDSRQRKSIENQYNNYYSRHHYNQVKKPKTMEMVEMENKPFSGVRFVGMHQRYSGKTEYFIVLPGDLLVSCKPAALMDAMSECGVNKGGEIPGEFIFARCDGEMLVVRVGSALHKACIAADERRRLDKKEKFALTAGRVYRTVSGSYAIFLGFVNTVNVGLKLTKEQKDIVRVFEAYRYNEIGKPLPKNWEDITLSYTPWDMATMWMETWYYNKNNTNKKMQDEMQKQVNELKQNGGWYGVKILKTHGYIEEVRGIQTDLPIDLFEKARRVGLKGIEESLSRRKERGSNDLYSPSQGKSVDTLRVGAAAFGWDSKKTDEYNQAHAEDHKKAYALFKEVAEAQDILQHSLFANSIVFGMQPIINERIEKIIKKFKKP